MCDTRRFGRTVPLHTGHLRKSGTVRHARLPDSFPEPDGRRPKDAADGKHFPNLDRGGRFPLATDRPRGLAGRRGRLPTLPDASTPTWRTVCGPRQPMAFPNARAVTDPEPRSFVSGLEACRSPDADFFRPHSKGTASSSSDGQRCEEGCLDVDALLQLQSHSCALTITYSFGTVN